MIHTPRTTSHARIPPSGMSSSRESPTSMAGTSLLVASTFSDSTLSSAKDPARGDELPMVADAVDPSTSVRWLWLWIGMTTRQLTSLNPMKYVYVVKTTYLQPKIGEEYKKRKGIAIISHVHRTVGFILSRPTDSLRCPSGTLRGGLLASIGLFSIALVSGGV